MKFISQSTIIATLTLLVAFAVTASAQTNSCPKTGDYWITTGYGGYCSASQPSPQQLRDVVQDQKTALTSTNPGSEDWRCYKFGEHWITTSYGGYCSASQQSPQQLRDVEDAKNAALARQQQQQQLQQQQAEYQRQQYQYQQQLLAQQAEYQRQLLQQQAQLARRQMAMQYLMNRPVPTPYILPVPQMPVYQNNHINCTSQRNGDYTYTTCN